MAKILYLGVESDLIQFLENDGNSVFCTANPINEDMVITNKFDFIVSYRYKFILPEQILRHFEDSAINLHASL